MNCAHRQNRVTEARSPKRGKSQRMFDSATNRMKIRRRHPLRPIRPVRLPCLWTRLQARREIAPQTIRAGRPLKSAPSAVASRSATPPEPKSRAQIDELRHCLDQLEQALESAERMSAIFPLSARLASNRYSTDHFVGRGGSPTLPTVLFDWTRTSPLSVYGEGVRGVGHTLMNILIIYGPPAPESFDCA